MAQESENAELFKETLRAFIASQTVENHKNNNTNRQKFAQRLLLWIDYDDTTINELSTEKQIHIQTITLLWHFLRNDSVDAISVDFLLDLFHQFAILEHPIEIQPDRTLLKQQMRRWKTGLDADVMQIRKENKERLIRHLIRKIEHRQSPMTLYRFSEDMSYEEKHALVSQWWDSARFHLKMAARTPGELIHFFNHSLPSETMQLLMRAKKKGMPFFVTPYYASLLNTENEGYDDSTIRSYVLYSSELVDTYGDIKAWEKEDEVTNGEPNAAGWLLPDGHNIHRRYPEVAILIPDSIGRSCGGLCASCQRMYDFQSKRLNFDFESLKVKESWDSKLRHLMHYFENDAQLRDILITGGDALMSQNATLRKILEAVYKMAVRKRKANEQRPDGEKFAELQRVRLGTRLPVYLPMRITDELVQILRDFKEKASQVGVSQFYIQTHFQSPLEVTPEAKKAIQAIQSAGWTITNQLVYNVAASRRGHTAKLRQTLNAVGIVCYYTFSVKGFQENYAVFTPNSRSLQETHEEKIFGLVPTEKRRELYHLIRNNHQIDKKLMQFLRKNRLLFAGTDRSVMNLPAIGKSMTFKTVGLSEMGQRILQFDHDANRRHSPIIDNMGKVYIIENKSIAAYLRQLQSMGEHLNEYQTIWNYGEGETEPCFSIYHYPEYPFEITEKITNM